MFEREIAERNIKGVEPEICIIVEKDSCGPFYYVGFEFKGKAEVFAISPRYRTVAGAEKFARKRYAA